MLEPLVGLIVAALLGVYLLYTLLHPENFRAGRLALGFGAFEHDTFCA